MNKKGGPPRAAFFVALLFKDRLLPFMSIVTNAPVADLTTILHSVLDDVVAASKPTAGNIYSVTTSTESYTPHAMVDRNVNGPLTPEI